uniref:Bromo domain-containing protein n=1 Tax=Chlamydomonas chlamydogama TaxID=225041 RepID=A0A6T5TVW3_9CHLO|mmetsp:Transcript_587/g.1313  ORF Transcript_587/g.1313 Transcript_587/m.1313 type:complete len:745 (+) Transcript_587:353-2587(+)
MFASHKGAGVSKEDKSGDDAALSLGSGHAQQTEARAALNAALKDVVGSMMCSCEHADVFQGHVSTAQVPDYHSYVDPKNEVGVDDIMAKLDKQSYASVHSFRRDFEQILANALAYNSAGHGRLAYRPVINWAQDLLDCCCQELESHHKELAALEAAAKTRMPGGIGQRRPWPIKVEPVTPSSPPACALSPMSSLEALVAACKLAAEQEGLDKEEHHYYEDIMAEEDQEREEAEEADPEVAEEEEEDTAPPPKQAHKAHHNHGHHHGHTRHHSSARAAAPGSPPRSAPAAAVAATAAAAAATHLPCSADCTPKYRRHKSKVFIRPNKVVYLPTTFMEEHFDPACLPINCEMVVETDEGEQPDKHMVTIKAVPRQGLSTMYCMTNVMKFQQQYLNWQILNWTKIDDHHIKIHLQGPEGTPHKEVELDKTSAVSRGTSTVPVPATKAPSRVPLQRTPAAMAVTLEPSLKRKSDAGLPGSRLSGRTAGSLPVPIASPPPVQTQRKEACEDGTKGSPHVRNMRSSSGFFTRDSPQSGSSSPSSGQQHMIAAAPAVQLSPANSGGTSGGTEGVSAQLDDPQLRSHMTASLHHQFSLPNTHMSGRAELPLWTMPRSVSADVALRSGSLQSFDDFVDMNSQLTLALQTLHSSVTTPQHAVIMLKQLAAHHSGTHAAMQGTHIAAHLPGALCLTHPAMQHGLVDGSGMSAFKRYKVDPSPSTCGTGAPATPKQEAMVIDSLCMNPAPHAAAEI